ncbi:hypothetical protein RHMOL_Rhmol05G0324600 [Rhododendron molle]|uniref:Uncharacterized protein n=1 Tax=Rhododendron molle TaxID=49168 RepID=A0ACC0NXH3_RHOML|nr:hypothetical protein RHMOL_Rhmol05G0324600 [Rhododendron molle]
MEGGRKVSASPRGPWSGVSRRKVLANKRPRTDGFVNSVKKLQRREISSKRDRSFSMTNAQERFRNMRLTVCLFLHLLCFPPEKRSCRRPESPPPRAKSHQFRPSTNCLLEEELKLLQVCGSCLVMLISSSSPAQRLSFKVKQGQGHMASMQATKAAHK